MCPTVEWLLVCACVNIYTFAHYTSIICAVFTVRCFACVYSLLGFSFSPLGDSIYI